MILNYNQFILKENLEKLNIQSFRDLYNLCPIDLQKRIFNLKLIPQNSQWHPEGNVLKHTILVVTRAIVENDINLALAALFHDIGKDATFTLKNGKPTAYDHENVSSEVVKEYSSFIKSLGGNVDEIEYIVKNHMRMKIFNDMKLSKQEKLKSNDAFNKLEKFTRHMDRGGY